MPLYDIDRTAWKRKAEPIKRRCHRCNATGQMTCISCGGKGKTATSRNVFGDQQFIQCTSCFGRKTRRCSTCAGVGFMT